MYRGFIILIFFILYILFFFIFSILFNVSAPIRLPSRFIHFLPFLSSIKKTSVFRHLLSLFRFQFASIISITETLEEFLKTTIKPKQNQLSFGTFFRVSVTEFELQIFQWDLLSCLFPSNIFKSNKPGRLLKPS